MMRKAPASLRRSRARRSITSRARNAQSWKTSQGKSCARPAAISLWWNSAPAALKQAVAGLNGDFSRLHVSPIAADYSHDLPDLRSRPGRKLVLFIGSTIGNFEPDEARAFLKRLAASLEPGDALLLGFDMV